MMPYRIRYFRRPHARRRPVERRDFQRRRGRACAHLPRGESCRCGSRGCLEVYASAKGIARRYFQATGENIGTKAIEKAIGTDPVATEVWGTAVRALALSLTHMTLTVDVERIIIGGGLSHAGENLLAPLREELASMLTFRDAPTIVRASLGGSGGRWAPRSWPPAWADRPAMKGGQP